MMLFGSNCNQKKDQAVISGSLDKHTSISFLLIHTKVAFTQPGWVKPLEDKSAASRKLFNHSVDVFFLLGLKTTSLGSFNPS